MNKEFTKKEFTELLTKILYEEFSVTGKTATSDQMYRALALACRGVMSDKRKSFMAQTYGEGKKQVYYLCMEFLMGRSLKTNLFSLGLTPVAEKVLQDFDFKIANLYELEPDAGLGNGGLGRLAACYLDGMATTSLPGMGYSILYEYGIFKQKVVDGWQQEMPDNWLPGGGVWLKAHPDQAVEVKFGGTVKEVWDGAYHHIEYKDYDSVLAIPYDMYVAGYESNGVSQLRLWSAKAPDIDMTAFNNGDYSGAVRRGGTAELISKVLYPNDNHVDGKILRLRQQYFLTCGSISDIAHRHLAQYGTMDNLPDKVAIHINDTHPTLAIPEFLRMLVDDCGYNWDDAYKIVQKTFAYTNHTVMSEALEKWDLDIFQSTLPRIYEIVKELDKRARAELLEHFKGDVGKVDYMALIGDKKVRMANICAYVCHSINGVSKLHSEIIKEDVFNDYFLYKPKAFKNVTNGIAYRRWLLQSNPRLTDAITSAIGTGFEKDGAKLKELEKFNKDKAFITKLGEIKLANKEDFAAFVLNSEGAKIDPASIFDVQVKRMHEYKRQHMNAMNIISEYLYIKNNPNAPFTPKTYIFGAKAAPGYYIAKQIIRLICSIGKVIDEDPAVSGKLKVVYLQNYSVTTSELLMPASDISEQISLAGTEASGTGNMKFMLNGAPTLGTLDGANVEIEAAVGADNFFKFGMLTKEANELKAKGYRPEDFIKNDEVAGQVLQFMERGIDGKTFNELLANLQVSDPYMVMADFKDYRRAQAEVSKVYADKDKFNRMSLMNIANSGIFSADRAVGDYAKTIWNMKPVK